MANGTPPTSKKFKWWYVPAIGFAGFIVLIAGCIGTVFLATSGAVSETNEFFQQLSNGKDVYEETSPIFQEATSKPVFEQFLAENPILTDVESLSFNSRSIETTGEGELVELQGTLYANDGSTSPLEVQLLKTDDEWEILYFTLEPTYDF